jgi:hypothetical protein
MTLARQTGDFPERNGSRRVSRFGQIAGVRAPDHHLD